MLNEELLQFLTEHTDFEHLGDQNSIIKNPVYGREIGKVMSSGLDKTFTMELSEILCNIDVYKACVVTNLIGFIAERENCTDAGINVLKLLNKALKLIEEFAKNYCDDEGIVISSEKMKDLYANNSDNIKAYFGCEILCVSAMAFLARDNVCREYLRLSHVIQIIQDLYENMQSDKIKNLYYLEQIHNTCGRIPLIILDPANKQGFIAEANDIHNNFSLLFLLEEAINQNLKGKYDMNGYMAEPVLYEIAHGKYPQNPVNTAYTYFIECDYHEIEPMYGKADNVIWGEMSPNYIPKVNGYHVIVLVRNWFERSFDSRFLYVCHPALEPYVRFERELDSKEYEYWVKACKENYA